MPAYCVIKSCEFKSARKKGMSFCRIPAVITNQGEEAQQLSEERRRLWLAAICIDRDKLTESNLVHGRVCGAHFVSGKAAPPWNRTSVDWVPTLKLTRSKMSEAEERAQERAQERAWRRFKLSKRRRRKAAIAALSNEEKHQSGVQTRPVPTATLSNTQQAVLVTALSAAKHARIPDSAQAAGEELQHGAGDHDIEGDRTPPVGGVLGFSKETTFALLPRMHLEELQSELNRRNIEVKLAGGDRPRGRGDLEHVLREVMTREYEEAEGDESMDVSDTSSTFQHGRSNTSSTFEHGHSNTGSLLEHGSFLEEVSSSEVLSGMNNDQTTTPNIQGPTGKEETPSSRQAADKNVSETPSTDTFPRQVQVKKEPIEQYHVAMTSSSSHTVPHMTEPTEPSTSQIGPTCTRFGMSQPNVTRSQNLAVKIKTEPGTEETTEEEQPESEDLSSEPCVSSPGQLSHELDMVDVSMGEEEEVEEDKLQSEEPVKTNTCPKSKPKKRRFNKCCKVYGCNSSDTIDVDGEIVSSKITFFSVPKKVLENKDTLKRWAALIKGKNGRENFTLDKNYYLCEKHFKDSDILRWSPHGLRLQKARLKEGAEPLPNLCVASKPRRSAPKQRKCPPPKRVKGQRLKKIAVSELGSPVDT